MASLMEANQTGGEAVTGEGNLGTLRVVEAACRSMAEGRKAALGENRGMIAALVIAAGKAKRIISLSSIAGRSGRADRAPMVHHERELHG